jgi:hypothetical protein
MRNANRRLLGALLLAAGLFKAGTGCSSSSSQRSVPQSCLPNETLTCVGDNSCSGVRRCLAEGVFAECLCDSDAGSQGGTQGSSGGSASAGSAGASSGGSTAEGGSAGSAEAGSAGSNAGGAPGGNGGAGPGGVNGGGSSGSAGSGGGQVFFDDFEDGNAQGWTPNTAGEWLVQSQPGNQVYLEDSLGTMLRISASGAGPWTDMLAECHVNIVDFGDTTPVTYVALYARFQNDENYYAVHLRGDGMVELHKRVAAVNAVVGTVFPGGIVESMGYTLGLATIGSIIRVYLNNTLVVEDGMDQELTSGGVAVGTVNARAHFDDVTVTLP